MLASIKRLFIYFSVIIIVLTLLITLWGVSRYYDTGSNNGNVFVVNKGDGVNKVLLSLLNNKIIDSYTDAMIMFIFIYITDSYALKAGEYYIPQYSSLFKIKSMLHNGVGLVYHSITIPEGLTIKQIKQILLDNPVLVGELKDLDLEEGFFLPETYNVLRGETRVSVLNRMQDNMLKYLDSAWKKREKNSLIATKYDALILASMVEKEAVVKKEKKTYCRCIY